MKPDASPKDIGRALVTGASGFVGRHLVEELLRLEVPLRVLLRDPDRAPWLKSLPVEVVRGDITEPNSLAAAVADVDTVFHLAAVDRPAHRSLESYRAINAQGSANLIDACRARDRIRCFVQASSVAVYGPGRPGVEHDESSRAEPSEKYAVTKLEAEGFALDAAAGGFPIVIARLEWVYGPHSPTTLKLFQRIAAGKLLLIGPCRNTHQPVWIGDAVDGLVKCALQPEPAGRIYNLAGPRAITVQQECSEVAAAVGVALPRPRLPLAPMRWAIRGAEILCSLWGAAPPVNSRQLDFFRVSRACSIERAKRELGWQPRYDFATGAGETAGWLRANGLI